MYCAKEGSNTKVISPSNPVQDDDVCFINRLIGHTWIHVTVGEAGMSVSGNTRDTREKFDLERPFRLMILKVPFTNTIATFVVCYERVCLEPETVYFFSRLCKPNEVVLGAFN